jgi:hypothetical protein
VSNSFTDAASKFWDLLCPKQENEDRCQDNLLSSS